MKHLKLALVCGLTFVTLSCFAQDWHEGAPGPGNPVTDPVNYVGCNIDATESLKLKTIPELEIEMFTNDVKRFALLPDATYTVGGSSVVADGFILHSPDVDAFYTSGAPGPFSLEHLAAATNSDYEDAYRDWAQTGTTYTGGGTMGYVGLKEDGQSYTDLVIQVAKRDGDTAPDHISLLFTSELNGSSTGGADSQEGLEGMRLTAVSNDDVNVGIGNFNAIAGEPLDRLDVGTGKVRIRQLPSDADSESDEVVTVDMTTGLIEHRPASDFLGGCEWTLPGGAGTNSNVATAYPSNPGCPQEDRGVGIGIWNPLYKLHVKHSAADASFSGGLMVNYLGNSAGTTYGINTVVEPVSGSSMGTVTGIRSVVTGLETGGTGITAEITAQPTGGASTEIIGVSGKATAPVSGTLTRAYGIRGLVNTEGSTITNAWGLHAAVIGSGSATSTYGVYAEANSTGTVANSYGVLGWARKGTKRYSVYGWGPGQGSDDWAGFFPGRTYTPGGNWTSSDESLKSNIEDIESASERLLQLNPKTYVFNVDQYPSMGLPQEQQYGFLAQELETVFPEMVMQTSQPAMVDSVGNEIYAAIPFKAVNLSGLTPYLVAAFQEQQQQLADAEATNDALNDQLQQVMDRLDAMEQSVANCCASHGAIQNGGVEIDEKTLNSNDRYLRIAPNPFETQTTIFYQLDQGGRMQLVANSADGKQLQVLQEASLEAGNYQYEWATGDLAPGVYYITLLVDAKPITKRVVKILR
ncbi:MAG: tail fiber domain-containing protein [Flavobacteriales bacterium]|nr:tail fiber domain-containing protein [Flavobacteriales bacterium]MBK6943382.1 tail fiber domain-containing protein [Flavobacteriales bacterium]MBP9139516.1 tail fiber domain-containing protein [Flavobacteriales bacterium]HQV52684.1 tail fiber domain-containing protein [Flavobacteriales bacterium]HQX30347.1 tail fiber domain-containing protein [Flavobacteriales bacterium]